MAECASWNISLDGNRFLMTKPPQTLMKPFNAKNIKVVVVGGKIQTSWFVTDFRLGRRRVMDT